MKARFLYRSDGIECGPLPASKARAIRWIESLPEGTPVKVSSPGFSSIGKRAPFPFNRTVAHDSENSLKLKQDGLAQRGLFAVAVEVVQ
jgi:hypothetical protein